MAIFVVSHPRSGMHLMIDFLRRNSPVLHNRVHIWDSAAELFVNLDVDDWRARLIAELDQPAERLAARLGLSRAPLSQRLPRCKGLFGKPSEVIERLTGREFTEVQIRYRKSRSHPDEAAEVDRRFADLQGQLSMLSIN
jgi:hypothetical protein